MQNPPKHEKQSRTHELQKRTDFAFEAWWKTLHPYQRRWISDPSRIALCVKARQIGFSHTTAADAVITAVQDGTTNVILSASQDLSSEVLEKAKAHVRILADYGHPGVERVRKDTAKVITFRNGGRVIALPANPRTARSYSGNVYFDEAAYHTDFKQIWDAAAAMGTRGQKKIRIVSTPNGAQGLFYEWATRPPEGWSIHRVTLEDAMAQGMVVDEANLWELAGHDDRVFAQWYRCSFLDAAMQFIPTAFADRALHWAGSIPRGGEGAEIHAGLDVGRTNDLTALTIVAVVGGVAYVLAIMTCRRTKYKAQRTMIEHARSMFRWESLSVDSTGIGNEMAEELVEEWGDDEVRPITFTLQSKADLATRSLKWFRDNQIRFPRDEDGKKLHAETISIRRVVTPAGNISYEGPQTEHGHCDRFWSLCLALKGAGDPQTPSEMGTKPLFAVA